MNLIEEVIVDTEEIIEEEAIQVENIIEGKTLSERLSLLKSNLHGQGSGEEAKKFLPDLFG